MNRLLILPVCLMLAVAGCGGDDEEPASQPASDTPAASGGGGSAGGGTSVAIKDFEFTPGDLQVSAGDTVEWTNEDSANHNVIFDEGKAEDIDNLSQDQSGTVKFTKAGTYGYVCSYHPGMEGTVEVQ